MKCPECGSEYDETDKFCRSCGASLSAKNERLKTDAPDEQKSDVAAPVNIAPELADKGKLLKYSLKVIFGVFIALSFLVYLLPVDFRANVYQLVGSGDYTNGLDGRWETEYFVIGLLANIFTDIDPIRTPCAVMTLLSFFCALFFISWIIVSAVKHKNDGYIKARPKTELAFIAVYATFAIASGIALYRLNAYDVPESGKAPAVLLVLSLLCVCASTVVYILRKRFFSKHAELIDALHIV